MVPEVYLRVNRKSGRFTLRKGSTRRRGFRNVLDMDERGFRRSGVDQRRI